MFKVAFKYCSTTADIRINAERSYGSRTTISPNITSKGSNLLFWFQVSYCFFLAQFSLVFSLNVLFLLCISLGIIRCPIDAMPRDWQLGIVIPIPKKRDLARCENYRQITQYSI